MIKDKGGSIMWTLYRTLNGRMFFVQAQISYLDMKRHGIGAAAYILKAARARMRHYTDDGDKKP